MSPSPAADIGRVELILDQLESLPTLSGIAIRVMELTAADDSQARDVIQVIASEPTLASKVLRLCRCAQMGRARDAQTVERAVMVLGFDAVRAAVLSVQVFEAMEDRCRADGEIPPRGSGFDRALFWHHALAVAAAAEFLAHHGAVRHAIDPADAFLAGLLHDLGHLALYVVLPRTFVEVCEWAEARRVGLDDACRRTIGLTSREAGRRLADHWRLPEHLATVMACTGAATDRLPPELDQPGELLVQLVTLADTIARRQHIAPLGHGPLEEDVQALAEKLDIAPSVIAQLVVRLHDEVSTRAAALGMDAAHSTTVLLRSISRANESLSRLALTLQQRNHTLLEARDELARHRTLASIAEIASGAAHEMNNPLAVISGRAQVLQSRLDDSELNSMARSIGEQAHRLSDLISALRLFAEPCRPKLREADLASLLRNVINEVRPRTPAQVQVGLDLPTSLPPATVDGEQLATAVRELVCNALEAKPRGEIVVRVQTGRDDDRLMIVVEDDGPGLTAHALAHAFDPFFSAKPAGRQPGLGLPRARRYVEAHGGTIRLENSAGPRGGAVATIQLPIWRSGAARLEPAAERNQQRRAVA